MVKITQQDNYSANFGAVLRSSAIFWIPPLAQVTTSIHISNYWRFKNDITVSLLISYRDIQGRLCNRCLQSFNQLNIICLKPDSYLPEDGGSIEIEAYSTENLRIPYAAIMATYESPDSLSMVHSYTRTYSHHEIEEGRVICEGHEGCWSLHDTENISSFAIIHNRSSPTPSQTAQLTISNLNGDVVSVPCPLPPLAPYQTFRLQPKDYYNDLSNFLNCQPGSAQLDFNLSDSFTRLLVGWQTTDNKQLQVTHSNFNYSRHQTDFLASDESDTAFMKVPSCIFSLQPILYPEYSQGNYRYTSETQPLTAIKPVRSILSGSDLSFSRSDGRLPSRIVTAISGRCPTSPSSILPFECSLGVLHHKRPKKHFHWALVLPMYDNYLVGVIYPEIYGNPIGASLTLKVIPILGPPQTYDLSLSSYLQGHTLFIPLGQYLAGVSQSEPSAYISIYSSYGGLFFFTAIMKDDSLAFEHTF